MELCLWTAFTQALTETDATNPATDSVSVFNITGTAGTSDFQSEHSLQMDAHTAVANGDVDSSYDEPNHTVAIANVQVTPEKRRR